MTRPTVVLDMERIPPEYRTRTEIGWIDGIGGVSFQDATAARDIVYLDGWFVGFNAGFASLIDPMTAADRMIIRSGGLDKTAGGEHGHRSRGAAASFLRPFEP